MIVRAPVLVYRWLVDNASRVVAVLWLAGMAFVLVVIIKRIVKIEREEAALVAMDGPAGKRVENGDGPEQVVEMMDVDEMNDIQNERMHALGLAAAGDSGDPDQAAIDAAREKRGQSAAAEGTRVGGAGNIVVVSKGGIAGWIKRNKGKKPDPETLAWLRGEEKADGRAAYAQWADSGDGDLLSFLVKNKGKRGAPPVVADAGSDAGSAGSAAGSAGSAVLASTPPPPRPVLPPPPAPPLDLYALGAAAVFATSPTEAVEHRRAALATLRSRLGAWPETHALEAQPRGRHVAIALPEADMFGADGTPELTPAGVALVRRVGAVLAAAHAGDIEIRGAADRTLEVATQLAIGGADADHIALSARDTDAVVSAGSDAAATLELVLLEAR